MYKVLIVAATRGEVEPLLLQYKAQKSIFSDKVFSFSHQRCAVDILITGVGMVATAFEMGFWLSRRNYDLLLNAGVCGSFDLNISLGTALQVVSDEIAEWGAEDNNTFIPITALGFFDADAQPYTNGKLYNPNPIRWATATPLQQVRGITVHKTTGNNKTIKQLRKQYRPHIETMESAAFFYAALSLHQKLFAAIRTVSNHVEPRDTNQWDLPKAIGSLNQTLNNIINFCPRYYTNNL